MQKPGPHTT